MSSVLPFRRPQDSAGDVTEGPLADPPAGDDQPGGGGGGGGAAPQDGEPDFGQVVPLGTADRNDQVAFVLLSWHGQRVKLAARQMHSVPELSTLFGGAAAKAWLSRRWPAMRVKRDPRGKPERDERGRLIYEETGDFSARDIGDALISACSRLGPADSLRPRRDGIWPGEAGGIVVHTGRHIYVYPGNEARKLGWRLGPAIHLRADPQDEPAKAPLPAERCLRLAQDFRRWSYAAASEAMAPTVLLGAVACGIYAAALRWRPHIWIKGPTNAGKSTLLRLLSALMGMGRPSDDLSEAYIRNTFDGRARPILLDEREPNLQGVQQVLHLMRGASGGEGAQVGRVYDGGARTFSVASSFVLAAISTPAFEPQDASRITTLVLRRPAQTSAKAQDEVEAMITEAAALYPGLLTRLVLGWERYNANLAVYRGAMLQAHATSRCADQLGALLAGHRTLVDDQVIDALAAAEEINALEIQVVTPEAAAESDAPLQVIGHLLASRVPIGDGRQSLTVAALLEEARDAALLHRQAMGSEGEYQAKQAHERWKKRAGMLQLRWMKEGLVIGNKSPLLDRCFDTTVWAKGVWRQALADLPGAAQAGPTQFHGGGKDRGVWLPADALPLRPPDKAPAPPSDDW